MTSQLTPQQIFDELNNIVTGYIAALEGYSDEQFAHKSADDVWSLGQMYEHLSISATHFFLANCKRCLDQRKGQLGGEKNEYGDNLYKYNSFPPIKIKIPEVLRGPEPVAQGKEHYKTAFDSLLSDAKLYIEPLTQDAGEYKCIQPAFGWLNAHEWFHLMALHFKHHLRQQKELEGLSQNK
jgi:hypothetical protein